MKLSIATGVVALVLSGVPSICGQSLGDIARHDRQRRSHLSSHPPVLTNEDLARDQILTPELRYRILAAYGDEAGPPPPLDGSVLVSTATPFSRAAAAMAPAVAPQPPAEIPPPDALFVAAVEQMPGALPIGQQGKELVSDYVPAAPVSEPAPSSAQSKAEPLPLQEVVLPLRAEGAPRDAGFDQELLQVAAPLVAQTGEDLSLGEYARQLRAGTVRDNGFDVELLNVPAPLVAQVGQDVSLGEYARQLRAERTARDNGFEPEVLNVQTNEVVQANEPTSLGEFARQLRTERTLRDPGFGADLATVQPPVVAQADDGISLGEYARQLQAVRSVQALESASLSPVSPPTTVREVTAEVSLGEYARQARLQRSAEEYLRLLAQADLESPVTASLSAIELPHTANITSIPTPAVAKPAPVPAPKTGQARRSTQRAPRLVAAAVQIGTVAGHIAVTVRRGDSLWRLARTYLGSGARWKSMSFVNDHPGSPDLIYEGEVVLIPVPGGHTDSQSAASNRLGETPIR